MSTEVHKAVVRRCIEEVVNTGTVDRVADFVSPDCIETDGKARVVSGVAGMAAHVTAVRAVWQGLTLTVERQIAEGEWVVTLVTVRGIHRGEWCGITPTGRPIVMTGVNVDRVVDGRIVEHGGAANMLDALLEIGAVRPVTEASDG